MCIISEIENCFSNILDYYDFKKTLPNIRSLYTHKVRNMNTRDMNKLFGKVQASTRKKIYSIRLEYLHYIKQIEVSTRNEYYHTDSEYAKTIAWSKLGKEALNISEEIKSELKFGLQKAIYDDSDIKVYIKEIALNNGLHQMIIITNHKLEMYDFQRIIL